MTSSGHKKHKKAQKRPRGSERSPLAAHPGRRDNWPAYFFSIRIAREKSSPTVTRSVFLSPLKSNSHCTSVVSA